MILRWRPRLVVLLVVTLQAACSGKTEGAPRDAKAKAADKPVAKAEPAPVKAEPAKPEPVAPTTAVPLEPPPVEEPKAAADAADPLGNRFIDPTWFRKEMLEGAKAMDIARSERNEQGLFSSQILFELPAGTTSEQCADQLETKVKGDVPNLKREPDAKAPGRLKLTGDTPRYRVTMMCGEAKGVMRAYVGYEWIE